MNFKPLIILASAIAMFAISATIAQATVTYTETLYTLTGDSNGGEFGSATISGTEGYLYASDGKDYIEQNITVNENVGGDGYSYSFSQNCLSILPGCGLNDSNVKSQIPGLETINVSFNIDFYALSGASSVVPTGFSDGVYIYSGSGTLTQTTVTGVLSAPEPGTWALMLMGVGAIGVGLRAHRRQARAAA